MYFRSALVAFAAALVLSAQEQAPVPASDASGQAPSAPAQRTESANPDEFVVSVGTRIPLSMINSVSTKTSVSGERVYLESVFPLLVNGHVVIPPGSYVAGTVTDVKRPGKVKGRGELYVRFDSLTLPNGVTRDFRSRLGSIDARGDERLDKKEGEVQGDSNKGSDARTVGEGAATGGGLGSVSS